MSHSLPRNLSNKDDGGLNYNSSGGNNWALTMVDDPNFRTMEDK